MCDPDAQVPTDLTQPMPYVKPRQRRYDAAEIRVTPSIAVHCMQNEVESIAAQVDRSLTLFALDHDHEFVSSTSSILSGSFADGAWQICSHEQM
jgi:hypothetical protein